MNKEIINIIEEKGVKATPMRMLVLEQMIINENNLSLTEIESLLFPADRTTIYRTLKTFVKYGIAHAVDVSNNLTKYALCENTCNIEKHIDYHPHIVCVKCNKTNCFNPKNFQFPGIKMKENDFLIQKIDLTVKGICANCR